MFVFDIGVSDIEYNIFERNLIWRTISKYQSSHSKRSSVVVDVLVENKHVINFQTWYGC